MEKLNSPMDWIGQIRFSHLPYLDNDKAIEAQKELLKDYIQVQHNLTQPDKSSPGYGYKYANLNAVLKAIQDAIGKLDLAYIQQPVATDGNREGVHNYLINSKGAILDFGSYMIELGKPQPQQHGSILTYTRRYSISAIFGIASEEDDDAKSFEAKPEFMTPKEVAGITVSYNGKRTELINVYAKAMAGDDLAKQVIKSKDNPVKTKLAIGSINKMYSLSEEIGKQKKQEAKKIKQEEDQVKSLVDGKDQQGDIFQQALEEDK